MKISEYSNGEPKFADTQNAYTDSFGLLWPFNQVVTARDKEWLDVNSTLLNNQVINRYSASVARTLFDFIEQFHPDLRLTIEIRQRIATIDGKDRDMIFQFCLAGEDRTIELSEECGECVRFLSSNMLKNQQHLDFGEIEFSLEEEKLQFLQMQVDALRQDFSGRLINEPFGMESCGRNRQIVSFQNRFDVYDGEPLPAKKFVGTAIVNGFRDSDNVVFLTILDENNQISDESRTFLVVSAELIDRAILARTRKLYVEFEAMELYTIGTRKPTFHLEELRLIESEEPAY